MQDDIKKPAKKTETTPPATESNASDKAVMESKQATESSEVNAQPEASKPKSEKSEKPIKKEHSSKGAGLVIGLAITICLVLVGVAVYIQL